MDGAALPAIGRSNAFQGASVVLAGIEKRFDNVGAVRGISLDIRSGEFLTLLGPSGSGKTTTLMMIAGFEAPNRGDIAIDGRWSSRCRRTSATSAWCSRTTRCSRI
jgi:ABC-type Fe3+/spermidine/putrescine transport system ATPase subunit